VWQLVWLWSKKKQASRRPVPEGRCLGQNPSRWRARGDMSRSFNRAICPGKSLSAAKPIGSEPPRTLGAMKAARNSRLRASARTIEPALCWRRALASAAALRRFPPDTAHPRQPRTVRGKLSPPHRRVVTHFESRRPAISSTSQRWSDTPAAIAGLTRSVL